MDKDIEALMNDELDYVTYGQKFTTEFLEGLRHEMMFIEQTYPD